GGHHDHESSRAHTEGEGCRE
ncbi:MAG: hypothetical protein AVDCRST_MAG93-3792, partial [uncultured Chloroflexia bacterium]